MRVAAYARYSSDQQSAASIDDQLRNCRAYCARMGWPDPVVFQDAAISGARNDRPGYVRMLANAAEFDVILVDDLSRLSRDSVESTQATRRLTFAGVRVIGISDGLDTGRKGHKADVGLRGLMSELYLDDLRDKTHRGLTGRALQGASAGGRAYGYRVVGVGQRAIDEKQAVVVRRIYAEYLAGKSPRAIAAGLNEDGIAPPRGKTWAMTAIHGDVRRGIGILANPIYVGRQVWNRSRWDKHPESGRRIRRERPESERIITEHPDLAIVDTSTWDAVQRRLRAGSLRGKHTGGRAPRHLLSGILRCGECGGPMVVIDRYRYGCAIAKDRGTCKSTVRFPRAPAEAALLGGIRQHLLSEEAFQEFQRQAMLALKRAAPDADGAKRRLAEAEKVQANIMAALRAGIITPSTKLELQRAETAIIEAHALLTAVQNFQPAQFLPRARETWRRLATTIEECGRDIPAMRIAIREVVGETIVVHEKAGDLFAEIAGSAGQINVVAGAGCRLYLTEPVRIPIPRRQVADHTHRDAAAQ